HRLLAKEPQDFDGVPRLAEVRASLARHLIGRFPEPDQRPACEHDEEARKVGTGSLPLRAGGGAALTPIVDLETLLFHAEWQASTRPRSASRTRDPCVYCPCTPRTVHG